MNGMSTLVRVTSLPAPHLCSLPPFVRMQGEDACQNPTDCRLSASTSVRNKFQLLIGIGHPMGGTLFSSPH